MALRPSISRTNDFIVNWQQWNNKLTGLSTPTFLELKSTSVCYRNWYQDWGHCGVTNDLGSSPQPEGEAWGLWWASQVVGDTTMTEIEVSISILSWCFKTYYIYADSDVYKHKIAHKTASNQPLWKAWPQPIVTVASLVTSWLPLWCNSARVTKSWQYASLKN